VQVRLRGYRPFEKQIKLLSGSEQVVTASLSAEGRTRGLDAPR
jgi:hypothetical protein